MAITPFTNALFKVNGTDLSDHTIDLTLNYGSEMLDRTAMGATSRAKMAALKTWSLDAKFNQDWGAGSVDSVLWAIMGTTACVEFRPVNAIQGTTNPDYSGVATLTKYPIGGAVGSLAQVSVTFEGSGDLARATSAT
jgi:hypothetical protein